MIAYWSLIYDLCCLIHYCLQLNESHNLFSYSSIKGTFDCFSSDSVALLYKGAFAGKNCHSVPYLTLYF